MSFQIKLHMFEGPLDLLLHLIREHQIDILDIPIATITEEYLRYIAIMQELDLDVAGEYLLMAATLIHIKSKMLLPPDETAEGEEAEGEDPRAELVNRLLQYKTFKEAAQTLNLLESETALLHRRGAPAMDLEVEGPLQVSMVELLRAFRDVLSRVDKSAPMEITPEEINVGQRIVMLMDRLAAESPVEFSRLFGDATRRVEVIVTFLALLELLRRRLATARQSEPMGPIVIYRTVERADETAESGDAAAGEARPAVASVADGMQAVRTGAPRSRPGRGDVGEPGTGSTGHPGGLVVCRGRAPSAGEAAGDPGGRRPGGNRRLAPRPGRPSGEPGTRVDGARGGGRLPSDHPARRPRLDPEAPAGETYPPEPGGPGNLGHHRLSATDHPRGDRGDPGRGGRRRAAHAAGTGTRPDDGAKGGGRPPDALRDEPAIPGTLRPSGAGRPAHAERDQ